MKLKGSTYKFGDNVNTDEIIPARYLNTIDAKILGEHCMEDADPQFASKIESGDIIVAGKNFGCGSSREHAPVSIKGCGIACVIAEDFARIFYRNAINIGLPILESREASEEIAEGDEIEVDFDKGIIKNITKNEEYKTQPFPKFMEELISAGGLMNWVKGPKVKSKK